MAEDDPDVAARMAAFAHIRDLARTKGHLDSADLSAGFIFNGERIPLVNPQRGIYKPRRFRHLLSIRTVYPKSGARVWYDDQRTVQEQIFQGADGVDYAFMGNDPDAADNRWLREAFEQAVPIIYFLGISPGRYEPLIPTFVVDWDRRALKARLAFAEPAALAPPATEVERRYAMATVKQRLHQARFREAVITAYDGRCALSGFPERRLLDAAHIISDGHETLGQALVPNGIPLSKLHHAAFDAHLIGIDPDYRIHVSRTLLDLNDGPTLDAIKRLDGQSLKLPLRERDRPDRDRLALRFDAFQKAA
jgi:putative restriction endonuclease